MSMRFGRLSLAVVLLVLLALAAGRSIRLVAADLLYRKGTPESVQSAIELEPGRALYHTGNGELRAAAGEDPESSFRRAAELKPDDAYIRMRLGLRAEAAGEFSEAEQQLLAAARVSRKYEPRWTLANYYYRRGTEKQFWRWAGEALVMSFGDRTALLDLCWRMDPTGVRLSGVIPGSRGVQLDYAGLLMGKQKWSAAEAILASQAVAATENELPRFLNAIDHLITTGRVNGAVSVWNALGAGGATPYPPLDSLGGPWITNGRFSNAMIGAGFDWRLRSQPDVYVSRRYPTGLRIELSGRQPGECEILHQYVAVPDGMTFQLDYEFRLSASGFGGATNQSGLVWRVMDMAGKMLTESAPMAAEESGVGGTAFRVPAGTGCVRLVLAHRRASGSVRMEGTVNLERVTLVLQKAESEEWGRIPQKP
jgi:tetratricopeptide (TPR) repeat protein